MSTILDGLQIVSVRPMQRYDKRAKYQLDTPQLLGLCQVVQPIAPPSIPKLYLFRNKHIAGKGPTNLI